MRTGRTSIISAFVATALVLGACDRLPEPPEGSRRVTIPSGDETLSAVEIGQGVNVAILSHGGTGTKEGFYGLAAAFADNGWRAIAYDARGVGDSTGPRGPGRDVDLRAVVAYARETGAESILLGGGSLGAALSIAMAGELQVQAVVSLSAPADAFGAIDAARRMRRVVPIFVSAAEDNQPFADDARRIAEVLGVAPTIVSGDGHGTAILHDHPEVIDAIVAFADDAIR